MELIKNGKWLHLYSDFLPMVALKALYIIVSILPFSLTIIHQCHWREVRVQCLAYGRCDQRKEPGLNRQH